VLARHFADGAVGVSLILVVIWVYKRYSVASQLVLRGGDHET
jgi:hypothetical protein